MNLSELSLSALEKKLRALNGECSTEISIELRALLDALLADDRAGARKLANVELQRRARWMREQERLAVLFSERARLRQAGYRAIAGVDEVGVGPLAGPVVAAAVILPDAIELPQLNDSKKLSPEAREILSSVIRERAVAWAIGEVSPEEIDRINIYQASLEAMRRAVLGLVPSADYLCVDARTIPGIEIPQMAIIKGDAKDASIAAASVVAKVYRDRLMQKLDQEYPGYGLAQHMGYPTPEHCAALERLGASPVHRKSYGPVAKVL